jgi:hypothetical protein
VRVCAHSAVILLSLASKHAREQSQIRAMPIAQSLQGRELPHSSHMIITRFPVLNERPA